MKYRMSIVVVLGLAAVSCSGPKAEPTAPGLPTPDPKTWELTAAEKAWVESKNAAGGLRAACPVREGSFTYQGNPDQASGLQADLVRGLGTFLGIPVHFIPVPLEGYFTRDGRVPPGVETDPALVYTPDVFQAADLVAADLTDLPWREKLMDLHPVFPNRMVLAAPRAREIRQLSDLYRKRVAVLSQSSHELFLGRLQALLGLDFTLVPVPDGTDLFDLVRRGQADALVQDANWVMVSVQKNPDFNVTLPLMPNEQLCWAVAKDNPVLGSIADKYLAKVKAEGTWDQVWTKAYGLSYETYLHLIGNDPPPVWTPADQAVLGVLAKTGLRVALHREPSEYEQLPDGSTRGVLYNLLLEVAKRLQVPLKIRPVEFQEFLSKGGKFPDQVKTDPTFSYKPDLFNQVDLYAGDFTPLDWRKKFMSFISVYPSKLVFVVRKQDGPPAAGPGRRFALLPNTSYDDWMRVHTEYKPSALIQVATEEEAYRLVAENRADFTLTDANVVIAALDKFPGITFFPADNRVDDLSWAVYKGNEALAAVLGKALDGLRKSGAFSEIWEGYYHVTLAEYLGLLALDRGTAP